MRDALLGSCLTAALWFGCVVLGFALVGFSFGWLGRLLLPANQHHLPRHLWMAWCLGAGIALGALAAAPIAVAEGTLALGDSLVEGRMVIDTPIPDDVGTGRWAAIRTGWQTLDQAIDDEIAAVSTAGMLPYVVGHAMLGSFYGPVAGGITITRVYWSARRTVGDGTLALTTAWRDARPDLHRMALRSHAVSALLTMAYLVGLVLAGLILVVLSWREVRRHRRALAQRPAGWRPPG